MSNEVYANGMEVACKAAAGKSMAAFPDTCLSPPSPPAGPVPIPYPNTAFASDTTNGSKTVVISGEEVMLKDQSTFKKSVGNEAATKSLGMGVVTHTIQGEASFVAWSMDVKIEGQNVDRHLDLMIHNEQCDTANTPPIPYVDRMALIGGSEGKCKKEIKAINDNCRPWPDAAECPPRRNLRKETLALRIEESNCHRALRCAMVPFKQRCCDGQTPDHVVPASMFFQVRRGGRKATGCSDYSDEDAPCVCAEGGKSQATHGLLGRARANYMSEHFNGKATWTLGDAAKCAGQTTHEVFPQCRPQCIESQVLAQHGAMGEINSDLEIKTDHEQVLKELDEFENSLKQVRTGAIDEGF